MNIRKFNERMGRPKYSRGGYIKKIKKVADREYFDGGGIAGIASALGMNAGKANINPGTTPDQLAATYNEAQSGINQGQEALSTLTPQVTTASNNQNTLANQELAMTRGAGPNPALNQLAQTTGQNVSGEAAALAGQRGSSANPGLTARTVGQVGANTEQQAVGQAATLNSQQEIAAQQNLANLSGQQVNQTTGALNNFNNAVQNEQGILQGANTANNNANVSMQSNQNNVNAQNNQAILGGITSGAGAVAGFLNEGGEVAVHPDKKHKLEFIHKMTKLGMEHFDKGGMPTPSPTPSSPSHFGLSSAAASDVVPQGQSQPAMQNVMSGFREMKADGGPIQSNPLLAGISNQPTNNQMPSMGYNPAQASSGPNVDNSALGPIADLGKSASAGFQAGQSFKQNHPMIGDSNAISDASGVSGGNQYVGSDMGSSDMQNAAKGGEIWNLKPHEHAAHSANHFSQYFAKGGESKDVPAMVSPQERYWEPEEVEQIKHGADPFKLGRIFPGKDKVPGKDSLKNDTIPVTLREGGIVNPLHIEKTKNPDKARLFVLKSLKATGKHMKKPAGMK